MMDGHIYFKTWEEYLAHAKDAPPNAKTWGRHRPSRLEQSEDDKFYEHDSFEQAYEIGKYGEPKLRERLANDTKLVLASRARIAQSEFVLDVEGEDLDIAAYVQGQPECWLREEMMLVERGHAIKHVKVMVNVGQNCMVTREQYTARGAVVGAAIILMERAGFAVTVDIGCKVIGRIGAHTLFVGARIKSPDQPLDIGRLAFTMTDPDSFRRIMFSVIETCPSDKIANDLGTFSLGRSIDMELGDYDVVTEIGSNDVVYDNKWIERLLASQGLAVTL
jgi:hypothetical protein